MLMRCCASGFSSVKTFLAAPAFCTVFTAFSYYPTISDHLWFSSFFPVEFEERCGHCVLPSNSLSPNNTLADHTSTFPSKEEKNAVAAWSKTPVLTPKPYFRGPELVPEKSLQQHRGAIQSSEECYGLASIFIHLQQSICIPIALKGWVPCRAHAQ